MDEPSAASRSRRLSSRLSSMGGPSSICRGVEGPEPLVGAASRGAASLIQRASTVSKVVEVHRLGDVVIHADRQATLPILDQGPGGHRDNRYPRTIGLAAPDLLGGGEAVHHRHVAVHQNGGIAETTPPPPGLRPRWRRCEPHTRAGRESPQPPIDSASCPRPPRCCPTNPDPHRPLLAVGGPAARRGPRLRSTAIRRISRSYSSKLRIGLVSH